MECPECLNTWNSDEYIPRILNCGHSLCDPCTFRSFSVSKIICPACKSPNIFTIERQFNDTDKSYASKCINTMPKNFSLLSFVCSRPSISPGFSPNLRKVKTFVHEISFGQMCDEHELPIHSYTEKPHSLLCDFCIDEISEYGLIIKPLPEVVNFLRESLDSASRSLIKKHMELNQITASLEKKNNDENQKSNNKLEEHFNNLKKCLHKIYVEAKSNLNQMLVQQQEDTIYKMQALDMVQNELRETESKILDLDSLNDEQIVS